MEHSFFNVDTQSHSGEHILFNTLCGSLAVLDDEAYRDYQNRSGANLGALKEAGFLTETATSEIDLQWQQFEQDKKNTDTLALCIAPTYQCNLACPHCYEKDQEHVSKMSDVVMDGIVKFVEEIYERDHFAHLFISWYGGEPTLCMDVIEHLSAHFIALCEARGIKYGAEIISNTTLINDSIARRLAQCNIAQALPTLAGNRELHNERRPCKSSQDSYRLTLSGIKSLQAAGLSVNVSLNMDKASLEDFVSMRSWLASKGIRAMPIMIGDYLGALAQEEQNDFQLFAREEFSWVAYEWYKESITSAEALKDFLNPIRNFCRRQLENYFVVDYHGDVYKCDGRMGREGYKLFNVCDPIDVKELNTATDNPMDDPLCRTCPVLPQCKGQCAWDRDLLEDGCHPFKYTIEQYAKDYRAYFGKAHSPVTVFVAPRDPDELFSQPNLGSGLTASVYPEA